LLKSYRFLDAVAFRLLSVFVISYAEALNAMGWEMLMKNNQIENRNEQEFCLINNCEHALEVSNVFVTEFLPRNLEKYAFRVDKTARAASRTISS
jgi:hypothetical protein